MPDNPPLENRGRRERKPHRDELREFNDTGASLWVATIVVIAALAVIMTLSQDNLKNGGAPFLIVPPSQTVAPASGNT